MTAETDQERRERAKAEAGNLRIYLDDCRQGRHCSIGVRRWFNEHGLDFKKFYAEGIDAATFIDQGDALSLRVVEGALKRIGGGDHGRR